MSEFLMGDLKSILPLLILWVGAMTALVGDACFWGKKTRTLTPTLCFAVVLLALVPLLAQKPPQETVPLFAGSLTLDVLGWLSNVILLAVAALSILLSFTYLQDRKADHGEYYVLLLFSTSGAMLMAMASDLLTLFLGVEILSFALYVLAGFFRSNPRSLEASLKYFLLGAFASAFLLFGIALIYGATMSTNLGEISHVVQLKKAVAPMLLGGVALVLVGLGFKAAVFPFHQWTPDVYEGSPTSSTAFMAAAAKIAAFAAMLRFFGHLGGLGTTWVPVVSFLAVLTMFFGNLLALTQTNVKRLLAYSSIAHAGYLLVAVATLSHGRDTGPTAHAAGHALSAAMFYLYTYALMTLGSFGVLIYLSRSGRECTSLHDLRGLVKRDPFAAYAMLFFLLSLGGIPPTAGFFAKWQILYAAVSGGEIALAVAMGLTSILAVYYYLKVVYEMFFQEGWDEAPAAGARPFGAMLTVLISGIAVVVLGVLPGLLQNLTQLLDGPLLPLR
jgi:NADH-quinone oxidoreductase subunit N